MQAPKGACFARNTYAKTSPPDSQIIFSVGYPRHQNLGGSSNKIQTTATMIQTTCGGVIRVCMWSTDRDQECKNL